ncbi:NADPH-dependent F420 reductase [Roseivirga sp. BDSF3-8]|uniref:NADPH-dependent F420 reductase n=1 Tax=Roseivirga sp. BDSF3-8 TaxID=3241598 RepID=UPI0035322A8D
MKVGIIGSGNIGGNLGVHLAQAGHSVYFSSRHPEQLTSLVEQAGSNAQAGTPEEAADYGEVVVLSIPYKAIEETAGSLKEKLKGKTVIDTCNPYPERDGDMAKKIREDETMRETEYTVQKLPNSDVVKAFNTIYFENLRDKAFRRGEDRLAIPLAGNDPDARNVVAGMISDIGFAPVDLGDMAHSAPMEVDKELYNKVMKPGEMLNTIKYLD